MGIFKKIGKAVKKVNLRGAIKGVAKLGSFVPGIGGAISSAVIDKVDQAQAKKDQQFIDKQEAINNALAVSQAKEIAQSSGITEALSAKTNPNFKDILQGALGGAAIGAGNVLAGTKEVGDVGATVVDSTINSWFAKNWPKVLAGVALLGLLIFGITKMNSRRR